MAPDTFPKLLLNNAEQMPDKDAIREKAYGIWHAYSWRDYAEEVRRFALGLASLGFKRGDRLAVVGDNRPRLYMAMLAAQGLGGISMALYQDAIAKEIGYVITHAEIRFIVAEDEEQIDKIYEIKEQTPLVEQVIFDDPRGLDVRETSGLLHFSAVQRRGDAFGQDHPRYFENEVAKGRSEDVAIFCYTSGTTGFPKGVMLTHENLAVNIQAVQKAEGWNSRDELMAYMPMAWIGEFVLSVSSSLLTGFCINCPESPSTVQRDYREIGPTILLAPPRNWENQLTRIQVRMEEADWLKRSLYNHFMGVALRVERLRQAGKAVSWWLSQWNRVGDLLVRAPLRDLIGASRLRQAYTGGAPLGPDLFDYFRALGINLKQLYGLTETSAFCIFQPDGEANSETVGRPLPGVEVKITDSGEILMRGRMTFKGYHKNEESTRTTVDEQGWFSTGDAGFIDSKGHLKVIDRAKDVCRMNNGTLFAPQYLENKLKYSPYIKEAVTLGKDRDYVAAMINIDLEAMENWAERNGLAYTGYQDLSQKPEVYALVHEEIVRINQMLSKDQELAGAQIRVFLILNKELDPDDGEITRTRKLRRGVIAERYAALIEALYSGQPSVETEIVVTYEDGRSGRIRSAVQIREVARTASGESAHEARQSA